MDNLVRVIEKARADSKKDEQEPFLVPNRDRAVIFM